jgi:hypothetical protein
MKYKKLKLLDDFLGYIDKSTEEDPKDLENELSNWKGFEISQRDRRGIILKLTDDKMVDFVIPHTDTTTNDGFKKKYTKDVKYHFITFEGLIHLEQDGYTGKAKRENRVKELDLITKYFVFASFVIAVGGLVVSGFGLCLNYNIYDLNKKSYEKKSDILANPTIKVEINDTILKKQKLLQRKDTILIKPAPAKRQSKKP